jgi:voltage-gated sodium channel
MAVVSNYAYSSLRSSRNQASDTEEELTKVEVDGQIRISGRSFGPEIIKDDNFQNVVVLVICLNILVLWAELDVPSFQALWTICDNLCLLFFIAESFYSFLFYRTRLADWGRDQTWVLLETAIVVLGVCDLWISPILELCGLPKSVRTVLHLLQLLRLLRLFKFFHQLMAFVDALLGMLGTFTWLFSVLFLFILGTAIVLTVVIGQGEGLDIERLQVENPEALILVQRFFKDIPTSTFTLFQLTTTDNWDDVATPLVEIHPMWRLFIVSFIVFASWIMLSVLTAVASDNMIAATSNRKEQMLAEQEANHLRFVAFLQDSFIASDADGSGTLDKEEFSNLIEQDFVLKRMKELGIHLTVPELYKAWDMLDVDESGELTIEEFVTGLSYLQEGLATKHIVHVDYSLKKITNKAEAKLDEIAAKLAEVTANSAKITACLSKQDRFYNSARQPTLLWQQWVLNSEFREFAKQNLEFMRGAPTSATLQ